MGATRSTLDDLRLLFNPRSVAVIGVSTDQIKRGRQVISNVMRGGFAGPVYGVGRNVTEADGAPCFPTVDALPAEVDVAFLSVPADATATTIRQCTARGVKAAIIGAAGFAENGDPAGLARQAELMQAAADTGIRIVGPNCNGIYNAQIGLALGFNAAHSQRLPVGRIAILSHSGALFAVMAAYLAKLNAGLSIFVSAGNEADFSLHDYLDYAIADTQTRTIALLLDSLADGERFRRQAANALTSGKRIVALKVGISEAGERAALAHSSRLAGNAGAYAALFDAVGVTSVSTVEGLMTTAALLSFHGRAAGELGMITTSGAGAAMLADLASMNDIPLTEFSDDTRKRLDAYRSFSTVGNPVDMGVFERGRAGAVPSIAASDQGVGAVMALVNSIAPNSGAPALMESLAQAQKSSGKPFVVVAPGDFPPDMRALYETQGLHCFPDTEKSLQAMGALLNAPPAIELPRLSSKTVCSRESEGLLRLDRPLTEPESLQLLTEFGLRTVATVLCSSLEAAIDAAESIGWPVVAKAVVPGLAHKTEAGLVRLDIRDRAALTKAFYDFASPQTLAIQPFLTGEAEAIAGLVRTRDVGPVLLAGLGGIYAEALREVTMWALPVARTEIERKLTSSALGRVLASPRWRYPRARTAFIDALLAVQEFALWAGDRVTAVDVNPLVLCRDGAVAVDALVVLRDAAQAANLEGSARESTDTQARTISGRQAP
jgi:acetate---CoA ligase (ADP-forming)